METIHINVSAYFNNIKTGYTQNSSRKKCFVLGAKMSVKSFDEERQKHF